MQPEKWYFRYKFNKCLGQSIQWPMTGAVSGFVSEEARMGSDPWYWQPTNCPPLYIGQWRFFIHYIISTEWALRRPMTYDNCSERVLIWGYRTFPRQRQVGGCAVHILSKNVKNLVIISLHLVQAHSPSWSPTFPLVESSRCLAARRLSPQGGVASRGNPFGGRPAPWGPGPSPADLTMLKKLSNWPKLSAELCIPPC